MTKIDRLASLLAGGMKAGLAAKLVGVSDSYVSQLLSSPDFKEGIAVLREEMAQDSLATDERVVYIDSLAAAEHLVLDQIIQKAQSGLMDDRNLISALAMIGQRRDSMEKTTLLANATKTMNGALASGGTIRMVEITMPSICIPELQIGGNSEIIAIGERSTATMPAAALQKMLDKQMNNEVIEHESF